MLDSHKLLTVAQELVDDDEGRLQMAATGKAFVQKIEIDGFKYSLYVLLEHIPMTTDQLLGKE